MLVLVVVVATTKNNRNTSKRRSLQPVVEATYSFSLAEKPEEVPVAPAAEEPQQGENTNIPTNPFLYIGSLDYDTPTGLPNIHPSYFEQGFKLFIEGGMLATHATITRVENWSTERSVLGGRGRKLGKNSNDTDEFDYVSSLEDMVDSLNEEIQTLQSRSKKQDTKMKDMEKRIHDQESKLQALMSQFRKQEEQMAAVVAASSS